MNEADVCVCVPQVDGVPVEVVRVSLFFKKKLMVVMMDLSIACSVSTSSTHTLIWGLKNQRH